MCHLFERSEIDEDEEYRSLRSSVLFRLPLGSHQRETVAESDCRALSRGRLRSNPQISVAHLQRARRRHKANVQKEGRTQLRPPKPRVSALQKGRMRGKVQNIEGQERQQMRNLRCPSLLQVFRLET